MLFERGTQAGLRTRGAVFVHVDRHFMDQNPVHYARPQRRRRPCVEQHGQTGLVPVPGCLRVRLTGLVGQRDAHAAVPAR